MENVIKDLTVSKEIKSEKEDEKQDEEPDEEVYDKVEKIETKNEIDLDKEFSEILQEKADIESDIKQLDEDPDKLNLETIEIDTFDLKDDNSIELDIEEL